MENLSQILWRERELLDSLLYALEQKQLVLATGRSRWLMRSAREVEKVLGTLRETEILRSIAADQVASSFGLPANPGLRELTEAAVEPWCSILAEHYDALVRIVGEISTSADASRDLMSTGRCSGRDVEGSAPQSRVVVDLHSGRTAQEASLAATARVLQPSLLDFLGLAGGPRGEVD